jgi:TPR repeat protein
MTGMMFRIAVVTAFLVAVPALAAGAPAHGKETVIFPEQAAVIPPGEIAGLQAQALDGSVQAAHRLADYYERIRMDFAAAIFWTRIRVENGDRDARYDLGAYMVVDNDPAVRRRGVYWLHAVEKDGPPALAADARSALQSMAEREKYIAGHPAKP